MRMPSVLAEPAEDGFLIYGCFFSVSLFSTDEYEIIFHSLVLRFRTSLVAI